MNECCGVSGDYRAVVGALALIQRLDRQARAVQAQRYVLAARAAGDDLDVSAKELAFQTSAETQALVKANRGAYAFAQPLRRGQRGERHLLRARTRLRPLLSVDRD
jgi:hypothetical protein